MRPNKLYEKLRSDEIALGIGLMYPSPGCIEGAFKDWDFVWIDGQHGQIAYDTALQCVQAAGAAGTETLIRVPGHEFGILGPFADLSPSAIMIPMVNTAEEARQIVRNLSFAPLGRRSYGGRRVVDLDGREYYRQRKLMIVVQIETLEACENVDAIAAVEGVDALFFGPDDMRVQLDLPINTPTLENDKLREAMARTAKSAVNAGKIAGTVAPGAAGVKAASQMGYRMIIGGSDIGFLRTSSNKMLDEMKTAAGEVVPKSAKEKPVAGVYAG